MTKQEQCRATFLAAILGDDLALHAWVDMCEEGPYGLSVSHDEAIAELNELIASGTFAFMLRSQS